MSRLESFDLLPRWLKQSGALTEECRGIGGRLADSARYHSAEAFLAPEAGQLLVLATGWACSLVVLPDGRRQILNLILPGDVLEGANIDRPEPSHAFRCVTAVQVCDVTALMERDVSGHPRFHEARSTVRALQHRMQSYVYGQVVRLGALSAYERVADLFLELFDRLALAGLINGDQFLMPLTQERLGEMLGLSETHVNRTLRQLRHDGLLKVGPGWYALPDRQRLLELVGRSAPDRKQG